MSNIHRSREGLDDEDMWLGKPPPQYVPAWMKNGMSRNMSRNELITILKRGRR